MMKVRWTLAIAIATALISGPVLAQDKEPEKMSDMMKGHHAKMAEMHQKMESAWKEQDAELDKLVTQMNSASGDQKVTAMAAVISKLVEFRKKEHEDMAAMHKKMQSEMEGRKKEKAETSPSPDEHSKHHP